MRRHAGGRRCGPRAAASQAPPGRPGSTARRHYARLPSMAGRGRTKGGESRLDRGLRALSAPGSAVPGACIGGANAPVPKAAMERREAPAFRQWNAA